VPTKPAEVGDVFALAKIAGHSTSVRLGLKQRDPRLYGALHMGLLALWPGDSLTVLLDGFVNRLKDVQLLG
jgi:hypothetical protein